MQPTRYPGIMKIAENTYQIRVRVTDPRTGKLKGVKRTRKCTLREAVALQVQWRDEAKKAAREARRERLRLAQYARSWMSIKLPKLKPSTAKGYARVLDVYILPRFGEYFVDAVGPIEVKEWIAELSQKYEGNTVRNIFSVLRPLFLDAVSDFGLQKNPCARVALPALHQWTEENPNLLKEPKQLAVLLEGFKEHEAEWYPLASALAWTGLRWGEATALEWPDLDEQVGLIYVRRAQWRGVVSTPKGKGQRTVPLVPELAEIMREHRRRLMEKQHPGLRSSLVFPSDVGGYHSPTAMRFPLANVLEKKKLPRITVHGLRRTFNNLVRQQAPGIVTRSIMGHVSEIMTSHYSIAGADEKKKAVAAVFEMVRADNLPSGGPSSGPSGEEADGCCQKP
jgi:integrase